MDHPSALFILNRDALDLAYGSEERDRLDQLVRFVAPPQTRQTILTQPELLDHVQVILSGWGAPLLDQAFLDRCRRLEAVFYAAGSIASWMTEAAWEREIVVCSGLQANAIPVAEYTLSTIMFSLKHGWRLIRETRSQRTFVERNGAPGCYGSTVGLVSLGAIGRAVCERLKSFDLHLLAYDPFVTPQEAEELGVALVSLDEVFHRSDVVSLHVPLLEETEGMISGSHLMAMKHGATLINTARGEVVRQEEMIQVLRDRPDLQAVLDVADPDPPPADSPLYTMPNVVLTPHMAGSVGRECRRMGRWMVDDLERYLQGQPLQWQVTPSATRYSSHRLMSQRGSSAAQLAS